MTRFVKRSFVFILVCLAWVFFRAKNVSESFYILRNIFSGWYQQLKQLAAGTGYGRLHLVYLEQEGSQFFMSIVFIVLMLLVHRLQGRDTFDNWVISRKKNTRWSIYYGMIFLFVLFGIFNRSEFIYFQF